MSETKQAIPGTDLHWYHSATTTYLRAGKIELARVWQQQNPGGTIYKVAINLPGAHHYITESVFTRQGAAKQAVLDACGRWIRDVAGAALPAEI